MPQTIATLGFGPSGSLPALTLFGFAPAGIEPPPDVADSIVTIGFGLDPEAILLLGFTASLPVVPDIGGTGPTWSLIDVEAIGASILDVMAMGITYIDAEPLTTTTLHEVTIIDVEPA